MDYERIVTHGDFDGLVSAAICSHAEGIERFVFTGPNAIERAEISMDSRDIVCDLPYPLQCGMWFDHHPGNLEALRLRGIDPESVPGRFAERPSCARVVFEHYSSRSGYSPPPHFEAMVSEADRIDAFDYRSIEEWREETPGKLVDMSLKVYFPGPREQTKYLSLLVPLLRDLPLEQVAGEPAVTGNIERYREEEGRMSAFVEQAVSFLPQDTGREIIILDFTRHKRRPRVLKNLAYLHHPQALAIITLNPLFRGGVKTNDFSVSMSLSMNLKGSDHGKDVGEILRSLGIGDGHIGAAAGTVRCGTKDEMLRMKDRTLARIWKLWRGAPDSFD